MKAEIFPYTSLAPRNYFHQNSGPRTRREKWCRRTRKPSPENGPSKKDTLLEICIRARKMGPISCPENGPDFGPLWPDFLLKRANFQGQKKSRKNTLKAKKMRARLCGIKYSQKQFQIHGIVRIIGTRCERMSNERPWHELR